MSTCQPIKSRPFIFKRWSRAPWAAFASIHRHVVIGVVKDSIANAQMLKSGRKFSISLIPTPSRRDSNDDDDDAPPGTLEALIDLLPTAPSTSCAPCRAALCDVNDPFVRNQQRIPS